MEKLKCSSCGAELEVEENKEYAKCNHCGARYKLNEDLNVNIKLDDNIKEVLNNGLGTAKHVSKFFLIPIIIFIIIMFSIVIYSSFTFNNKADKSSFNFQFSYVSGTKDAFFVDSTLDKIIESNNTHGRKVALVYDGKETTDKSEIIEIKHSLSGTYEVSLEYDEGYVSKVILDKLEQKSTSDYIKEKIEESQKDIESSNEDFKKKVEEMQEEARSFFDN